MNRINFMFLSTIVLALIFGFSSKPAGPESIKIENIDKKVFEEINIPKSKYSEICELPKKCGSILAINCGAEVDGPFFYVSTSGEMLMICGGECDVPKEDNDLSCKSCPYEGWKCGNVY